MGNFIMQMRSVHLGMALAAAWLLAFAAPHTASAWKLENEGGVNSGANSKFVGPDGQAQNYGRSGSSNFSSSGSQFYFGAQSSEQARNPWSNPAARPLTPEQLNQGNGNYRN
jgi:hypothetical protein